MINNPIKSRFAIPAVVCALAAWALPGQAVADDHGGMQVLAGEELAEWPSPKSIEDDGGVVVPVHNIAMIEPGMRKHQVYPLVGTPNFLTGFQVRHWNYQFQLKGKGADASVPCQYQIQFARGGVIERTVWRTQECADLFKSHFSEEK